MRRSPYRFRRQLQRQQQQELYRANERITALEVRVIDDQGGNAGVMPTAQAIALARSRELDLVEVSPKAQPPVARIIDYGQFKYWKEKELRKQKAHAKKSEVKGIRLSMRIGAHDMTLRQNQTKKFFDEGHRVKIDMILKGRERQHIDLAKNVFKQFTDELGEPVGVDQEFVFQNGKASIIIFRKGESKDE